MTSDLGKYLRVPLLHQRMTKETFGHLFTRVTQRLNTWKASSLSLAGRTTLTKVVLEAIPAYTMQINLIPISVCDQLEKESRRFLWGSTCNKKKIHAVKWSEVCQPKVRGGLGLRHLKLMNSAFMMKAGQDLIQRKDELWVRVVRTKYGYGLEEVPRVQNKKNCSNLWKGIVKIGSMSKMVCYGTLAIGIR